MPVEMERKLKAQAQQRFGSVTSARARRYIWGTLRKTGWRPKRER